MATKSLQLPCGIVQKDGSVERHVEIRKMKARLLRDVARLASAKNPDPAKILETILQNCVVRVGDQEGLRGSSLARMLLADRDWLLFEIRKFTRGNMAEVEEECDQCEAPDNKILYPEFDLDSFELTPLDEEDCYWWDGQNTVPYVEGMPDPEFPHRVFVVENEKFEAKGVFRYPDGADQKAIAPLADQLIEATWMLMTRTCVYWTDYEHKPVVGRVKADTWDDLDIDLMEWVQEAFSEKQPGLDTTTTLTCPNGHSKKVVVSPVNFLFRKPDRAKGTL